MKTIQGRSQTSEQDEAIFESGRREPLGGENFEIQRLGNALVSIFCGTFPQKSQSWVSVEVHFLIANGNKKKGQNQVEATASSCLMLATALLFKIQRLQFGRDLTFSRLYFGENTAVTIYFMISFFFVNIARAFPTFYFKIIFFLFKNNKKLKPIIKKGIKELFKQTIANHTNKHTESEQLKKNFFP